MKVFFLELLLFFTINWLKITTARNVPGNEVAKPVRNDRADDTLELVQIIFRHGDRTPIVQYPNDPLQNESIWYQYASGFESLTKKGRQMHYEFGKYLRNRYTGFLSDVYSPKEIFVQSSDADRAIMSALSNLAGMWPPIPKDPKSEWNPDLAWQPIPVHTIPKPLDNFINFGATCPRFKELKEEYIKRSPFADSINKNPENLKLCNYVMNNTGLKECDFETISDVWDTLRVQKLYNFTLPPWVFPVYDQMEKIAPLFFDPRVMVPNDEAKRVKGGPLLSFLVRNMDVRRNLSSLSNEDKAKTPKANMYMLSGHDSTSAIALGSIGVFDTQFPGYASAAIFEMHKGKGESQDDHFVRIFFRNDTSVPPYEFQVPKCGFPCKLDTFKQLFSNIIIDGEQWKDACQSGGSISTHSSKSESSTGKATKINENSTLIGLFLILCFKHLLANLF